MILFFYFYGFTSFSFYNSCITETKMKASIFSLFKKSHFKATIAASTSTSMRLFSFRKETYGACNQLTNLWFSCLRLLQLLFIIEKTWLLL